MVIVPESLRPALYGGIAFALVFTVLQYIFTEEFNLIGLFGGTVYFIAGMVIWFFRRKER